MSRTTLQGSSSGSGSGSMLCASHGSVAVCGRRREMEDTVSIEPDFLQSTVTIEPDFLQSSQTAEIENFNFYAVYDGHGGSDVAQLCKDRLHQVLADEIYEIMSAGAGAGAGAAGDGDGDGGAGDEGVEEEAVGDVVWERIMKSCFGKFDDEIARSGVEEEVGSTTLKTIGSTAVVAVVGKEKLVVANCGDSRAVLCRGGVAVPLSVDHKPERPDEQARVEAAGGRIIDWNGYRVLGVLATSRSIGDHYLRPYVISEPEVIEMERTINDEFLILASDGLWDVLSNEVVCEVVRKCLDGRMLRRLSTNVEGNNASEAAAAVLTELAMARGSKDNISVLIVELKQR